MTAGKAPPDERNGAVAVGPESAETDRRGGGRSIGILSRPAHKPTIPHITGLVSVDLSDCADEHGFPTHQAHRRLWGILINTPAGASVEIRLGNITWFDDTIRQALIDYGGHVGEIILVGPDPDTLHHEIRDLRYLFSRADEAAS